MASRWLDEFDEGIFIAVDIQPGAKRSEVVGIEAWRNSLKVAISARPIEGAANAELIALIAKWAGVKRENVSLVSGNKSRRKRMRIVGVSSEQIRALIED
ncbi:MAG TPA: YggU family protein [Candidatus Poseidoniales archaeon]|jgi:hypothetical protein|nr:YggU family protein [Candidatus Poseidoniales archaeon]|tara:strand:- start:374 stop:673 length:300 start_codon:yes stop_codon:yes gene_type:complete